MPMGYDSGGKWQMGRNSGGGGDTRVGWVRGRDGAGRLVC